MRFRPCIDIHNGQVKQIVGGSLNDCGDKACENFASLHTADYYADLYKRDGLDGGHVILLNPPSSQYYERTRKQAMRALDAFPGGLQIGGGITAENASDYLDAGASHVIVTSYVFREGRVCWDCMEKLKQIIGKEHVVIDLSCRKREGSYYIVTDRWQKFTEVKLSKDILDEISQYCDEFLIHGVDVEGKASGIDETLAAILGGCTASPLALPLTYAGGIGSIGDIEHFRTVTGGRVDFTIGSALDLFGGPLPYDTIKKIK
ncbi:MAG: phosphoribosylformimino-5-aminoimidazole carboxamide ribotide isomerase [Dorea sp.]|nr:phosphoribosylformimino-5-aminoimidazole carboxamide ribotide isomerase [Dorea sp.]